MSNETFRKVADGALWMLFFKFIEKTLGLIGTLILVRLLDPTDFGIVAMAVSAIALAELFTAFGFDTALIQHQRADPSHYHSAWTLGVIVTGIVSALAILTAPFVADFYDEEEVYWVVVLLGFSPLLVGLQNIGIVDFRKHLRFQDEFRFQVSKKIVGFALTVPIAFITNSYWALVAGSLGSRLFGAVYSYFIHPFRPRFELKKVGELMNFSQWLFLANLLEFIKQRSSAIIIGRTMTAKEVGIFSVSYEFANLPTTELGAPINRALLPGFAKHGEVDVASLYSKAISTLALIALPASAGIAATAHLIVPLVLGPKWVDAIPVVQILAINGAVLLLQSSIATLLIATGFPRRYMIANAVFVATLLPTILILTPAYGLPGAAWAYLISSVVATPVFVYLLKKTQAISPLIFIRAVIRPAVCAVIMAVALELLPITSNGSGFVNDVLVLLSYILAGIGIYVVLVLSSWVFAGRPDGGERVVIDRFVLEFERLIHR